jgi:hypothetical protein
MTVGRDGERGCPLLWKLDRCASSLTAMMMNSIVELEALGVARYSTKKNRGPYLINFWEGGQRVEPDRGILDRCDMAPSPRCS